MLASFLPILLFALFVGAASAQEKDWEKQWNQMVAAARKEGRVVVATSPDAVMRQEVIPRFKARFGVDVEYLAGSSSQLASRLRIERQAGAFTIDVMLAGIQTVAMILYPEKMLDPLKPALILPEVVEPSKWKSGKLWFVDPEEKYVLRAFSRIGNLMDIHTDYVKPSELRSIRDLLNPKWKGKISTEDPTVLGTGSNQAARFYIQLGEEFVKRLYVDQKPLFTRDRRQIIDWLARGTAPISFSARTEDVEKMRQEGFPIVEIFDLPDFPGTLGASPWLVTLMNRAPNPNAARLFVNWIVSKEGLDIYSRARTNPTLRADLDESFLPPQTIPRPGVKYFDSADWEFTTTGKEKIRLKIQELLKSK
jgi:iron(III) transport system substrate-binding protein